MPSQASVGGAPRIIQVDFRQDAVEDRPLSGRFLLSCEEWKRVGDELNLSPRELELIQHIFDGNKLTAIAQDMGLAHGTVKTYTQRIHQKLGVSDQVELTLAVVGAHLQLAVTNG